MDIEGSEWKVLEYMMDRGLLNNVLQLAVEIHSDHVKTKPTSLWLAEFQSPAIKKDNDDPPAYEDIIREDRNRHEPSPDKSNEVPHYIDIDLGLPTYTEAVRFVFASDATTR
ncbi:uncharacterized protein [Macrobrachium rosenbergii]|uniref:uncharacterized protein isoform X1 n=1 Tax=Macrobrachium rosenbergii TaxID=79674 RepID=UPI0034D6F8A4